MKIASFIALFVLVLSACQSPIVESAWIPPTPSNVIDGIEYVSGNWEPHLAAGDEGLSWGNHRAVVHVENPSAPSVQVVIPWRRLDSNPNEKAIVVVDSTTGEPIPNALAQNVTAESGTVVFEPNEASGTYYVYFLPWESTGGYYPRISYPSSVLEPDSEWQPQTNASEGKTVRMESVDDFHSFFPMEVPATQSETSRFADGQDWLVIPEYGRTPISMRHNIPVHWTSRTSEDFTTKAYRDESHAFQLGVFAAGTALENVEVQFAGFPDELMSTLTCFNCEGVSFTNESFSKVVSVPAGDVQPLWIGVQVPADMEAGSFTGQATVSSSNAGSKTVDVTIEVEATTITNHGYDDPASQSRLAWLNSQAGRDADFIIDPYLPVTREGKTLSILGRDVELGPTGLPAAISSYFTEEMTGVSENGAPILAEPLMLFVQTGTGSEQWQPADFELREAGRGRAEWTTDSQSGSFDLQVEGALEYDGMLDYRITLTANRDVDVQDVTLPITYAPEAATWLLGLGHMGQKRPDAIDWKWKVENHQEGLWMGAVNKGLQYVLRDDNYERPLNTNFYQNQPLNMPVSWENEGKGGIRMVETAHGITMENYSGSRSMKAGDELHFNVRFLITPFKHLDTKTHFNTRFVHKYVPVDSVVAWGGTVVNIHHANEINPYINYPFYNLDGAKDYIDEAHEKGIKVKLYNTIREVTYKTHELFAMRSLGEEIFNGGDGGGHSWMQEHLRENYHSAWHAWRVDDAAILNKGTSRWTNYYIEGLSWLAANQEMDGLYLDDIAFSRETVKRMISVLHAERDEVVIDLHSANQFNPADGHINSAMLYMEHFPFISRLWFGEYFDYDQKGDYWMTEVAGLPFGLMGEMLQGGGHPYRGMLYGMTTRMYGDVDPRPVWKMMNDFGIDESRMLGYWLEDAPVDTGNDDILATVFVNDDEVLIALASWSDQAEEIDLKLDLNLLGLSSDYTVTVPSVEGLQEPRSSNTIRIPANQGLYVVLRNSSTSSGADNSEDSASRLIEWSDSYSAETGLEVYLDAIDTAHTVEQIENIYRFSARLGGALSESASESVSKAYESGSDPWEIMNSWLASDLKAPGIIPSCVAECTEVTTEADYEYFKNLALNSESLVDDEFFSIAIPYWDPAGWTIVFQRTWDYGGHSRLGDGAFSNYIRKVDSFHEGTPSMMEDVSDIREDLFREIGNTCVGGTPQEALAELAAIQIAFDLTPTEIAIVDTVVEAYTSNSPEAESNCSDGQCECNGG